MRNRLLPLAVTATCLAAWPAAVSAGGLAPPAYWIAPGGGPAWPPAELGYGDAFGDTDVALGGVVGLMLVRGIGLEARGHLMSARELSNLYVFHSEGNLTWFLRPEARLVPFATAGAGLVRLRNDYDLANDFAWNAGAGVLLRFSERAGVRLDVRRVSYQVLDLAFEAGYRPHMEVFAGLNLSLGGTPVLEPRASLR